MKVLVLTFDLYSNKEYLAALWCGSGILVQTLHWTFQLNQGRIDVIARKLKIFSRFHLVKLAVKSHIYTSEVKSEANILYYWVKNISYLIRAKADVCHNPMCRLVNLTL